MMKNNIDSLSERMLEIVESQKNKENIKLWEIGSSWNRDMWRGIPIRMESGKIPHTIALDNSMMSRVMEIDLRDYYSKALCHLETQLRMDDYHFSNWNDNHVFTKEVFIWFGVVTELSFFGPELVFFPNREAWIGNYIIKSEEDLDKMEHPDFFKSGLMPVIHRFYEEMNEVLDGRLKVMFPSWVRGPFCIAAHLRGLENILVDMLMEPEFVHKLMRFITDSVKKWTIERSKFLNEPITAGKLYNDEIDCPTVSPDMYREFVLPYEVELSEFYGGIKYWHSCGNTTKIFEQINKIPNLEMFHVSPWADEKKAAEIFNERIAFDICVDPQRNVLERNEVEMIERLEQISDNCKSRNFAIRADAFQQVGTLENDLGKIRLWDNVASKVLRR
jgi:uroporphyrinogen-III decarboxylase